MTYYKLLNEDGTPCNGGSGRWSLPTNKPGKWMPAISPLVPCQIGYHVCEFTDLLKWQGPALFEVELRGQIVRDDNKTVASEARLIRRVQQWNDKNLRLFAADCAENVLDIYCKSNPEDGGMACMFTIHVAREFAHGRADLSDLAVARGAAWDAAGAAAWGAAWDAAGAAAWDAAGAAAGDAARDAAWDAAGAAAGDAAWDAAWGAARAAAREWQYNRLAEYLEINR